MTFVSDSRRRVALTADENDAHTTWRHIMVRYKRAGAAKRVKRRTNRRERREVLQDIREQDW